MAKIDAIDVPKLTWPEAAAPSTPASGKVVTYAKSDGLMYSKDDAGTETLMSGGTGSGTSLNPGSSFPGSPATDTLCYRTDRDLLYYYDGTRWLTVQVYSIELKHEDSGFTWPLTASGSPTHRGIPQVPNATFDTWLLTWETVSTVLTTNNGTNFWTGNLHKYDNAGGDTTIATFATSADAANGVIAKSVAINALLGAYLGFYVEAVKTLSPGNWRFHGGHVRCRLVG